MKKNIILYVAITILLCALTGLTTYIILDKKDNKTEIKENETKLNEQKVIISDNKLKEYLNYIPNDYIESSQSVYVNPTNVIDIDKSILLGKVLNDKFINCVENRTCETKKSDYLGLYNYSGVDGGPSDIAVISKKEIDSEFLKRYNNHIPTINESTSNYIATYYNCYWYTKDYFIETDCVGSGFYEHLSVIENYETKNNELIIYEYAALAEEFEYSEKYNIITYDKLKEIKLNNPIEETKEYFNNHKQEFTKYKHTFKKNETGYYWYSTEVA